MGCDQRPGLLQPCHLDELMQADRIVTPEPFRQLGGGYQDYLAQNGCSLSSICLCRTSAAVGYRDVFTMYWVFQTIAVSPSSGSAQADLSTNETTD